MGIDDELHRAQREAGERERYLAQLAVGRAVDDEVKARLTRDFLERVRHHQPALPIGWWERKGRWWSSRTWHSFTSLGVSGWNVVDDEVLTTDGRWIVGNDWVQPVAEGVGPRPSIEVNAERQIDSSRGLGGIGAHHLVEVSRPLGSWFVNMQPLQGEDLAGYRARVERDAEELYSEIFAAFLLRGRPTSRHSYRREL